MPMGHRTRTPHPIAINSPASTRTGPSPAASAITCRRRPRGHLQMLSSKSMVIHRSSAHPTTGGLGAEIPFSSIAGDLWLVIFFPCGRRPNFGAEYMAYVPAEKIYYHTCSHPSLGVPGLYFHRPYPTHHRAVLSKSLLDKAIGHVLAAHRTVLPEWRGTGS